MLVPLVYEEVERFVKLLDQTLLPTQERWLDIRTPEVMAEAICKLRVRGAPAIGIAAAYGVVLALRSPVPNPHEVVQAATKLLGQTRPTAVNLSYALGRMRQVAANQHLNCGELYAALLAEARAVEGEDRAADRRLAVYA